MKKVRSEHSQVNPLNELKFGQRYHVHLTLLYGVVAFVALAVLGSTIYQQRVDKELISLQQRLLVLVSALAEGVDAESLEAFPADFSTLSPSHRLLHERFVSMALEDSLLESIYVLRPTDEPTQLRFFVDYSRAGKGAVPGDKYDASELLTMLQGFSVPVVESRPNRDEFGNTLSGYAPVKNAAGSSVALVGADVNASSIYALNQKIMADTGLIFGITVVVLGILSIVVAQSIRKPLGQIIEVTAALAGGDFSARSALKRNDEFGIMGRQIDAMAEQLQKREFIRETFGRYVSEAVAIELLADDAKVALGGEERIVSILFSDLRNYSGMSENLPPAMLVKFLNHYFGEMSDIIEAHEGCVIEFLGDGILAVFGAPKHMDNHAEQSVRCAMAMCRRLTALQEEWRAEVLAGYLRAEDYARLGMRIGVHSGPVVAGNLGSPTRMKYAVIGDAVNIAARLEAMNKMLGTDLLISGETYNQLPNSLSGLLHAEGVQEIRGREKSVLAFSFVSSELDKVKFLPVPA